MLATAAITYVVAMALLLIGMTPEQYDIKVGYPASLDILATKDVTDAVTTEASRKRAADLVEESYRSVDDTVMPAVTADMSDSFNALLALRDGGDAASAADIGDDQLELMNLTLPVPLTRESYAALMEADGDALQALFGAATSAVRDALISTLPEGQEDAAVTRISRMLASSGYDTTLVALTTDVMRKCVKPNMLIDTEITEANRQKAMDAVEPKTFLKGEAIVRRGERVTEAQYQMLSTLGLLKEDTLDYHLVAGVALLVVLLMAAICLYAWCFDRERLRLKTISLLCVIFLLVLALSLALSYWNAYMMPVALGVMLTTLLVDRRMALFMNLGLGVCTSLLANASGSQVSLSSFLFIVMSLVSGPTVLWVLTGRQQRTRILLSGVVAGISNFLGTLAVGLINSAELTTVLTNAVWTMGAGLLSAVLCIGIQPILELIFNLATNSRLIELSNPNQPLLRRLLLEAPGTYHHSIIVANLAEAGADAIGANGLLARVGAYYHDVGKLKRPGYFTENQVGDNPHDRTDPRVSAAILTAHPRDGYQLAQKARIPQPVLDIIRQHHGDGVTLYFYDRAVKLYGAEHVDIAAFRYEGPRPRTKEAATVMLADTIEAATRSIPNPTPEKIDGMIRKLVRGKMDDGQLDESDLTFKDLEKICSAFSTVLTGVFHERIEYPDVTLPPRTESAPQAEPAAPAAGIHPAAEAGTANAEAKPDGAPAPGNPPKPAAEEGAGAGKPAKPAAPQSPDPARPVPLTGRPCPPIQSAADGTSRGAQACGTAASPAPSPAPAPAAAQDSPAPGADREEAEAHAN